MALGRPKAISGDDLQRLRSVVQSNPTATLDELCQAWQAESARSISVPTLRLAMREAGLERTKHSVAHIYRANADQPQRYGYTQAHRSSATKAGAVLSDAEWALAHDLFTARPGRQGRPAIHDRRQMVEACCYVLRTGCSWRMLPKDVFPPWPAVQKAFTRWAHAGKFEQLQDRLRQQWRERIERNAQPSGAVIDSQSTRSSSQGGEHGYDAGKKVKGRKRHLVVDTLGLLLAVVITCAAVQDRDAAAQALEQARQRTGNTINTLFADSAYAGKLAQSIAATQNVEVKIIRRVPSWRYNDAQASLWPLMQAMPVLPKRWVVERSHAWLEKYRRLNVHYDRSIRSATAWVWLAQARMLMTRLTAQA